MTRTKQHFPALPVRLQRSELAVPATSAHFFQKAATCAADAIFLDLEDAVAPALRAVARDNAVRALDEIDWGHKTMSIRVNDLTTPWALPDILAVAKCPRLDMVLLPKVETPDDVVFVDRLLAGIELGTPRRTPLGLEILIETARGLANVEPIAAASSRLEGIIFGVGDYSIELESFDLVFGVSNPDYAVLSRGRDRPSELHWNDQWHFALARIANACRAYGLRPIDGPYTDYADEEGYRASCRRARALGFEGKWAIHPNQIAAANEEFTPDLRRIEWAEEMLAKVEAASAQGKGTLGIDHVLVDRAHLKLAQKILRRAELIRAQPRS